MRASMRPTPIPDRPWGLSNSFIFWRIRIPACRQGILAGAVLAFARALGEYGATSMVAGYTPGRTATISTTVYQLWRTDNDALAFRWVLVNVVDLGDGAAGGKSAGKRRAGFPHEYKTRGREVAEMSLYVDIRKKLGDFPAGDAV